MSEIQVGEKSKGASISMATVAFILSIVAVGIAALAWKFIYCSIGVWLISMISIAISTYLLSKEKSGKIVSILSLFFDVVAWLITGFMLIGEAYIYVSNYIGI